jgi:voltage-gated potassium channel
MSRATPSTWFLALKHLIEDIDSPAGRRFNIAIGVVIIVSIVAFSVETLPALSVQTQVVLDIIELVTVLIFSVEHIARLWVADRKLKFVFSFFGLIDLLAIAPFFLALGVDLRTIRVLRLMRVFRIFKFARYSHAFRRYRNAFVSIREELVIYLFATAMLIFLSSVGIYYFENEAQPDKFASVFHALWWSVVTLTTVGYGDVFPITVGGRMLTGLLLMFGVGVVAVPSALLAAALTRTSLRKVEARDDTDPTD